MTKKVLEQSVSVYLRMPTSSQKTLEEMASHLGMKASTVTNALFRFVTQPHWFVGWEERVNALREIVDAEGGKKSCLYDFSIGDWLERRQTYDWLQQMGLIEDFDFHASLNYSGRMICSFKISDAGRVIGYLFKEVGIADPIAQDELEKAPTPNAEGVNLAS